MEAWKQAMAAHAWQAQTRNYLGFQLARAALNGRRCGVDFAMPLFPNDPLVVFFAGPNSAAPRGTY